MAVKTNKLAETIKSDLAITVGIYSWETSYSLNQAHTSTVHTPHQTRWIQIIWQIFWKFLINQIRIFNFTFCVPSLFFLCVCVCCAPSHLQSAYSMTCFFLSLHIGGRCLEYRSYRSVEICWIASLSFLPLARSMVCSLSLTLSSRAHRKITNEENETRKNRQTKLARERKTISTVCHLVRWMSAQREWEREREHTIVKFVA